MTLLAIAPLWIGCGKDSPSSSKPPDKVETADEVKEAPPAPPPPRDSTEDMLAEIEEKNRGKPPTPLKPQQASAVMNALEAGVMGKKIADADGYAVFLSDAGPAAPGRVGDYVDTAAAIKAKEGWHLDDKTPPRLVVSPPDGVTLDKSRLERKDAVVWERARGYFQIIYKVTSPGEKAFTGELEFSICSKTGCTPAKVPLEWKLAIQ